ncbi:hypothetical protein GCM10023340_21810 [Nocardioides marinquilinus]|uniref:Uncharacterized protein n=1 Tax=Nocardioides marinquilinus TaxID=1210400 RepID=A0ABP9PML3_9ACTN
MRRLTLAAAPLLAAALGAAPLAPAHADARVDVVNDRGTGDADVRYRTTMTVTGRGFQVVPKGFGGVYVMFGWVDGAGRGSWRPSRGGLTGRDYRYIPDAEDASASQGYLRYVAFPGGSTAGEADTVLSRTGGFSVELVVPGPVFQSVDRDGAVAEVDCREVTCGVITIGAHGVANAANETFTPVRFGTVYDDAAPDTAPDTAPEAPEAPEAAGTNEPGEPADVADPTTAPTPTASADPDTVLATDAPSQAGEPARGEEAAAAPGLTVDRVTAVAGHAMTFTGRGFRPGEQVVGVLDDGIAALGPLVAGGSGEVAGVLQLPANLEVGTHELRLTGAASGVETLERFAVAAADAPTPEPVDAVPADAGGTAAAVFVAGAGAALLLALAGAVLTRRRARRTA